jgi:hypothetical protein
MSKLNWLRWIDNDFRWKIVDSIIIGRLSYVEHKKKKIRIRSNILVIHYDNKNWGFTRLSITKKQLTDSIYI